MKKIYYIVFTLFFVLIVLPVIDTFAGMFFSGDFSANLKQINAGTFILLSKSILIALSVATISTILGIFLSFLLYKTQIPYSNYLKITLLIPLFISPYIMAVAWRDFFYLFFHRTDLISSVAGSIFVMVNIFTPLSMLIIGSALSNINAQLEESAQLIASLPKVVLKIILPLIKPAIISSFVLIFIFSISEFSVPAYFGVQVFTTEIFTQFSAFYNHSLAVLQSLFLVLICIFLLFTEAKYLAGAPFLSVGAKGTKNKTFQLKRKNTAFGFIIFYLVITVVFPLTVLFIQSFKNGTDKFIEAFGLLLPTFVNSFELAFWAAFFTMITGFSAAYFSVHNAKNKLNVLFNWFLLIVFAIPSIIFGISLIKFYNQAELAFIYTSAALIIIAYVGKFSFISAKIIENSLVQIPKSLDEAAQIEGISPSRRLFKIIIPLIMPALFAAFMISFIFNLGELVISIMLYPPGMEIMPVKVYTLMANAPQALTSSMTLIVFLISLFIISVFYLIFKKFIRANNSITKY